VQCNVIQELKKQEHDRKGDQEDDQQVDPNGTMCDKLKHDSDYLPNIGIKDDLKLENLIEQQGIKIR
jgi:hypothetical protein